MDDTEALKFYQEAASRGSTEAEYHLGYAYYYGKGVHENRRVAFYWLQAAASHGNFDAQRMLGLRGSGVSARIIGWLGIVLIASAWAFLLGTKRHMESDKARHILFIGSSFMGVAYVVLSAYQAFGVFSSFIEVNMFILFKNAVLSSFISLLAYIVGIRGVITLGRLCAVLLFGINVFLVTHHELRQFSIAIFGLAAVEGLLAGSLTPLAARHWLQGKGDGPRGEEIDIVDPESKP